MNIKPFLDMIAVSELGQEIIDHSDNGYDVLVGSTPDNIMTFDSYADHPRKLIEVKPGLKSTAAGRYQLLARYFDAYRRLLDLPDFGPDSQDAIAIQQIKERGALPDIEAGNFDAAVQKVSNIWASLPGNDYGQHQNDINELRIAYLNSGGTLS